MPGLIGRDGFERVAQAALELPGVDGVEVLDRLAVLGVLGLLDGEQSRSAGLVQRLFGVHHGSPPREIRCRICRQCAG